MYLCINTFRFYSLIFFSGYAFLFGTHKNAFTSILNRLRAPFNVNIAALAAAIAVLDDEEFLKKTVDNNTKERERWEKLLHKYDILREELSKKTVYNHKQYGLWLDYNYASAMEGNSDPYYR